MTIPDGFTVTGHTVWCEVCWDFHRSHFGPVLTLWARRHICEGAS